MESDRQFIDAVLPYSFSFKSTKKIYPNISKTQQQIHTSQILSQNFSTWLDLVQCHCPQIIKYYPVGDYTKLYNQQICLIDAELKFQGSLAPPLKYTLLKSQKQVDNFKTKYGKKNQKKDRKAPSNQNIFDLLSNFSINNQKDKLQFQDFIEQVAPHSKWNIRVIGQYRVSDIEEGSFKGCMNQTVLRPCQKFNRFYLTIANQCILYTDESLKQGVVQEAIPYTFALKIDYVKNVSNNFVAKIISGKTQITAAFQDLHDLIKFAYTINIVKKQLRHYFEPDAQIRSFSPVRQNNWTKFYGDGKSYFSDLYDAIEKAQKKICITGWCITPYLLLKRPESIETGFSRLDRTLERAAKRGVKIFILVFQEPSLLLSNDSFNIWSMFEKMHENFKVLRHPGILIPILWSHHEKSVIIDEKVGFMGGLDICYGRWDTPEHPVYDKDGLWQGADYNNERLRAITQPRKFNQSNLNKENEPRMPWQDIALQVKGPSVVDMQRHFCQYWYFAIHDLTDDVRDQLRNFKTRYDELKRERNEQKQRDEQLFNKPKLNQQQMNALEIIYANSRQKDKDYDYSFADRIRHAKQALKDIIQNQQARSSKQIIVEGFSVNQKVGNMKLQLCRSSSTWSTGIQTTQHSIYDAYLKLIKGAENFIYIENQFFMSFENLISETIAEKIIQAHSKGKDFKIIVMMPLLPGFQGDPRDQKAGVLRGQMQLQFQAISRHESSIFQIVKRANKKINIEDYIYSFGLRNHGLFGSGNKNVPKTEIIYVHSKLMIVDDRHMIIGSANINDRSLLGSRDSELAMVIEDPNGSYGKGEIFDFRCQIFGKHFGLDQGQCQRKCRDLKGYWDKLINYAKKNTQIYRKVFGCYPDNTALNFGNIGELERNADLSSYNQKITELKGHYVEWPVDFLRHENLSIKIGQKQFLLPKTFLT